MEAEDGFCDVASAAAAAAKAGTPDVYVYDRLPPFLRNQIAQIFVAEERIVIEVDFGVER